MATVKVWTGSVEQIAFRDAVLTAHLKRSFQSFGDPKTDLPLAQLGTVAGTSGIKMEKNAAGAATSLIAKANEDLKAVKLTNINEDAKVTLKITASSGYRSATRQKELWLEYFPGYYDQSVEARAQIAEGVHSEKAIRYLLNAKSSGGFGIGGKIAAPGYSNHQTGIAIDLLQKRKLGFEILNSTASAERKKWQKSWFYEWLTLNAKAYKFEPYSLEEWHWEYQD
jgi:LAS superfamily LD-carboxypeptidase LdcB